MTAEELRKAIDADEDKYMVCAEGHDENGNTKYTVAGNSKNIMSGLAGLVRIVGNAVRDQDGELGYLIFKLLMMKVMSDLDDDAAKGDGSGVDATLSEKDVKGMPNQESFDRVMDKIFGEARS